jgi:hypothetical protein
MTESNLASERSDAAADPLPSTDDGSLARQILAEDRFARLVHGAAHDPVAFADLVRAVETYRWPEGGKVAVLRVLAEAATAEQPDDVSAASRP